ncbi:MAG: hypothetical protein DRI39_05485 [Chloroflexi bacterium]|mgnify:CR=1 FL=1|nr:MAG: hypothetical protein DRI39_05485 [Chloroflexota bacterium]
MLRELADLTNGGGSQDSSSWHHYLLRWLLKNTGTLRAVSYERIRSQMLSLCPRLTDEEIRNDLLYLKDQGVLCDKGGALGGQYWFVREEWRRAFGQNGGVAGALAGPDGMQDAAPHDPQPGGPGEVCVGIAPQGDILDLLKGEALERLVLLILRRRGGYTLPECPGVPFKGTPMDVWAETEEGALILVECKGWDERVCHATVREFTERVAHVRKGEPHRNVEAWLVSTGELTPQTEVVCREAGVRVVKTLELLRDALAYGIVGIGLRSIRPYVACAGEHGVFLEPDKVKAVYGDPRGVVRIV